MAVVVWNHRAHSLLLGAMQFSDRHRNLFRQIHHVVGRIYIVGVLVATPLGFYMQCCEEHMGGPRCFQCCRSDRRDFVDDYDRYGDGFHAQR